MHAALCMLGPTVISVSHALAVVWELHCANLSDTQSKLHKEEPKVLPLLLSYYVAYLLVAFCPRYCPTLTVNSLADLSVMLQCAVTVQAAGKAATSLEKLVQCCWNS